MPKNILIIVAMEVEENAILERLNTEEVIISDNLNIPTKQMVTSDGSRILITRSGVGIASAALNTGLISMKYKLDAIFLLGVGGGMDNKLNLGDVLVAEKVVQHDAIFSGEEGNELMRPGELFLSLKPDERPNPDFVCNHSLLEYINRLYNNNDRLTRPFYGTLISGSEFVARSERKKELKKVWKRVMMIDMEAAGVAMVADKLDVPFLALKTVVDRFDSSKSISNDYIDFIKKACENSARITEMIIENLSELVLS